MNATLWTYLGQIVNFIIFVVILYYLLYRPVGRILKERKDAMEADLRKAEELRAAADKARAEADQREKDLEDKRDAVLKEARDQAEAHRKEVLKKTEDQARARVDRFRRVLKQERDELLENVTDELRGTILHVARAVIGDDTQRLTDQAIERVEALLADLSADDLADARAAMQDKAQPALVRSAAPLNEKQQGRLRKTIEDKLDLKKIEMTIAEEPALLAGLEVALGHVSLTAHWQSVIDDALRRQKEALHTKPEDAPREKNAAQNSQEQSAPQQETA